MKRTKTMSQTRKNKSKNCRVDEASLADLQISTSSSSSSSSSSSLSTSSSSSSSTSSSTSSSKSGWSASNKTPSTKTNATKPNGNEDESDLLLIPNSFNDCGIPATVPFSELLQSHSRYFVWGFQYGELNKRLAEENMRINHRPEQKSSIHKSNVFDADKSSGIEFDLMNCGKDLDTGSTSEINHKTPYFDNDENHSETNKQIRSNPNCNNPDDDVAGKKSSAGNNGKTKNKKSKKSKRTRSNSENVCDDDDDDEVPKSHIINIANTSNIVVRNRNCCDLKGRRNIPEPMRRCPDNIEIWNYMVDREDATVHLRNGRLFYDFKDVTPRMRAILLDWLMEVCEVYHLRRVTYFLGVDYFDRFLSIRPNVPKQRLQLVGITCLYIASKVEEIYPPNITEFAYVCDGACLHSEIIACELLILNSLGWETITTTVSDWLNLYLQLLQKYDEFLNNPKLKLESIQKFVFPVYSQYHFYRASQLMDLFSLDPGFLRFPYSTMAAAAIYYLYGREKALLCSGVPWCELELCVNYMSVFYKVLNSSQDPKLKSMLATQNCLEQQCVTDCGDGGGGGGTGDGNGDGERIENHSYQTHAASMDYFEQCSILRLAVLTGRIDENFKFPPSIKTLLELTVDSNSKSATNSKRNLPEKSQKQKQEKYEAKPSTSSTPPTAEQIDSLYEKIFKILPSPDTNHYHRCCSLASDKNEDLHLENKTKNKSKNCTK